LVYSAEEDGSDLRVEADVADYASAPGWLSDGRLIVVSARRQVLLRREDDGTLVTHADLSSFLQSDKEWLADMVVAKDGTAYVGSVGFDLEERVPFCTAPLLRVTPQGEISVASEPLRFPNGLTIIDDKTLVVAESYGNRLSAFDIRPDGSLSERRDWASLGPTPAGVYPDDMLADVVVASDGISSVDVEGAIWVADFMTNRAVRILGDRGIVDEVRLATDDFGCYAAALGGADGQTLFLCADPLEFDPDYMVKRPRAHIQSCRVPVPAA
jgi:sugar lactone lactonase YvrE